MNILGQDLFLAEVEISRCAGIMYDRTSETEIGSRPGRRIDAHVTHGAADHNALDPGAFERIQKRRFTKTVRKMFLYHGVIRAGPDNRVYFRSFRVR